jgi:hypothetical protein
MLETAPYLEQHALWPQTGRRILAHFDTDSVVVYQAYRPEIGVFAAHHGHFGGEFSYSRMSWIKPNFLWMMYRSAWGTKPGQEVTLAVRMRRPFFESLLARAVESRHAEAVYATRAAWQEALARSNVRLQWDPDHDPTGAPQKRRALQLGLRGDALSAFGRKEILEIIDISEFVRAQRPNATRDHLSQLVTPVERIYLPADEAVAARLGLDGAGAAQQPSAPQV